MKVFITDDKIHTELFYIESGDIFQPTNSLSIYFKLANNYTDDVWNKCDSQIINYFENSQDHEIEDIRELTPCVDIETGEIVFFHKDLQVTKLNYLLKVEE